MGGRVGTPAGANDAPRAYAVCINVKHKICSRNGGTVAKGLELKAECVVQARTTCKEVCAQSRFCNFGNSGLGKLVQREHGNRLHKNGRVCCFDKCRVPQSWGLEVKPHLWCA